ncbi:MAG: rubredoxin [Holdemanella sp.]|nr:rubredoxin [Holdemanella sp.]
MKYICKICGYVYDEIKQGVLFSELPDAWRCPLCGAAKSNFQSQIEENKTRTDVVLDDDMKELSTAQLSALCSNLARGCEKQYMPRQQELYTELAKYFKQRSLKEEGDIKKLLEWDLNTGYMHAKSVSSKYEDRGALRVCTWGEKVTFVLHDLMERYEKEGASFLDNTGIWVCSVCGFVYVGDKAPSLCPVCKVPDWKFEKVHAYE